MATYNRYSQFINNGEYKNIPFIKIPESTSDKYEIYKLGKTRLDLLSYKYYDNPNYGFFILMANPEYGGLEFSIPDGAELRIPYPIESVVNAYKNKINEFISLNE